MNYFEIEININWAKALSRSQILCWDVLLMELQAAGCMSTRFIINAQMPSREREIEVNKLKRKFNNTFYAFYFLFFLLLLY